jgi:hypothetical protein
VITFSMKSNIGLNSWMKSLNNEKLPPVVKKHAFAIQANAASEAPVDTGALKNSLAAEPIDPRNWTVKDGVEYGVFQELGTSRGVRAKHFLGNACEKEAESFFSDVAEAMK